MKKVKQTAALFMAIAMILALGACNRDKGDGDTTSVSLKVWGSQEDQAMLKTMVENFKKENTDQNYNITFGVVGEKDTQTKIMEDPEAAADVFAFPDDQLNDLLKAGVLYEITLDKEKVKAENTEGSVAAATVGDKLYAYPMTADNGYFLYYDKSVYTENDVKTMDSLLEIAAKKNKKVLMDISNGWYISSFFLGAGCKLGLDENGKQTCDFNNDKGLAAGEAIKLICAHPGFMTGEDAILTGGIGTTLAAGISGTWTADAIREKLGTNYAATKLPTFTLAGNQVQMKSFAGYKLMGVNAQTKRPKEAMKLAEYLTNEKNQLLRFETRAMGPSNKKAAENEKVKQNIALAALSSQNEYGVSQANVLNSTWKPLEAFGTAMETKDYKKTTKEYLDTMVSQIVS